MADVLNGMSKWKWDIFACSWLPDFVALSSFKTLAARCEKEHNQFIEWINIKFLKIQSDSFIKIEFIFNSYFNFIAYFEHSYVAFKGI
jgi:hypothetical protein